MSNGTLSADVQAMVELFRRLAEEGVPLLVKDAPKTSLTYSELLTIGSIVLNTVICFFVAGGGLVGFWIYMNGVCLILKCSQTMPRYDEIQLFESRLNLDGGFQHTAFQYQNMLESWKGNFFEDSKVRSRRLGAALNRVRNKQRLPPWGDDLILDDPPPLAGATQIDEWAVDSQKKILTDPETCYSFLGLELANRIIDKWEDAVYDEYMLLEAERRTNGLYPTQGSTASSFRSTGPSPSTVSDPSMANYGGPGFMTTQGGGDRLPPSLTSARRRNRRRSPNQDPDADASGIGRYTARRASLDSTTATPGRISDGSDGSPAAAPPTPPGAARRSPLSRMFGAAVSRLPFGGPGPSRAVPIDENAPASAKVPFAQHPHIDKDLSSLRHLELLQERYGGEEVWPGDGRAGPHAQLPEATYHSHRHHMDLRQIAMMCLANSGQHRPEPTLENISRLRAVTLELKRRQYDRQEQFEERQREQDNCSWYCRLLWCFKCIACGLVCCCCFASQPNSDQVNAESTRMLENEEIIHEVAERGSGMYDHSRDGSRPPPGGPAGGALGRMGRAVSTTPGMFGRAFGHQNAQPGAPASGAPGSGWPEAGAGDVETGNGGGPVGDSPRGINGGRNPRIGAVPGSVQLAGRGRSKLNQQGAALPNGTRDDDSGAWSTGVERLPAMPWLLDDMAPVGGNRDTATRPPPPQPTAPATQITELPVDQPPRQPQSRRPARAAAQPEAHVSARPEAHVPPSGGQEAGHSRPRAPRRLSDEPPSGHTASTLQASASGRTSHLQASSTTPAQPPALGRPSFGPLQRSVRDHVVDVNRRSLDEEPAGLENGRDQAGRHREGRGDQVRRSGGHREGRDGRGRQSRPDPER